VHLVHKNQDYRRQLDEHDRLEPTPMDQDLHRDRRFISAFRDFWSHISWDWIKTNQTAELLPQPEPLNKAPHREKRFVSAFLPQFDARIWDWAKQLFQGYQEATEVLTPLENDTWTADVVLQAANLVSRKKREVKSKSIVSTMMDWLQLPLFRNQTLLTLSRVNHTISEPPRWNSTEGTLWSQVQFKRYSLENILDLCIVAVVFLFAVVVAFAAGLAGKRAHSEDKLLIVERKELEQEPLKDDDIIQDCENCDFHLEYPLVHLPEES
jgi:hypothetical protein